MDGIRMAVQTVLNDPKYKNAAEAMSRDFRTCSGSVGAAEFIENAPHATDGVDILEEINRSGRRFLIGYWILAITVLVLFALLVSIKYAWIPGLAAGIIQTPLHNAFQKRKYEKMIKKK